jgi:hypothetical protein
MASIIKSDNGVSSGITGIVQSADSSGQLVLQTTTSSGTATTAVTIDNTQVATFANTLKAPNLQGPAFSAYMGSAQSISNATFTKLQMNTVIFDTNSNYNNSTYRFTPTVAGYYQVTAGVSFAISTGIILMSLQKNGVRTIESTGAPYTGGTTNDATGLIYLNGSTDYVEAYAYQTSGGSANTTQPNTIYGNYFQAVMVRSA